MKDFYTCKVIHVFEASPYFTGVFSILVWTRKSNKRRKNSVEEKAYRKGLHFRITKWKCVCNFDFLSGPGFQITENLF
jgi:hypothetical protein